MDDTTAGNQGPTHERLQHSRTVVEPRTVTNGGVVIGLGFRDTEHCLLDRLLKTHALGNEDDQQIRYETGYKLRRVYFDWRASGRSLIDFQPGCGGKAYESDEPTQADLAEQHYHHVMRALPSKYHKVIRFVCLSDAAHGVYDAVFIRESLDALSGAFYRAETHRLTTEN
jgi:hypothetical protein